MLYQNFVPRRQSCFSLIVIRYSSQFRQLTLIAVNTGFRRIPSGTQEQSKLPNSLSLNYLSQPISTSRWNLQSTHVTRNTQKNPCSQPRAERGESPLSHPPSPLSNPVLPPPLFLCLVIRLHTFVEGAHSSRATVESWLCLAYPTTGILMNMSQHSGREKELHLSNATQQRHRLRNTRFNAGPGANFNEHTHLANRKHIWLFLLPKLCSQ